MKIDTKLLTKTALMISLIFVAQQLRIQYLTGPVVNIILAFAVIYLGLLPSILISIISPVLALILGVMPMAVLLPFIMLGNISYVIIIGVFNKSYKGNAVYLGLSALLAAITKAVVIGGLAMTVFPFKAALTIGVAQLTTAAIGSIIAVLLVKSLECKLDER